MVDALGLPEPVQIGTSRLEKIMLNRPMVHDEMKKHVTISKTDWAKIEHYYDMRNQLVHRRATVSITDEQIGDFRTTIEEILKKLFKLKFST